MTAGIASSPTMTPKWDKFHSYPQVGCVVVEILTNIPELFLTIFLFQGMFV